MAHEDKSFIGVTDTAWPRLPCRAFHMTMDVIPKKEAPAGIRVFYLYVNIDRKVSVFGKTRPDHGGLSVAAKKLSNVNCSCVGLSPSPCTTRVTLFGSC